MFRNFSIVVPAAAAGTALFCAAFEALSFLRFADEQSRRIAEVVPPLATTAAIIGLGMAIILIALRLVTRTRPLARMSAAVAVFSAVAFSTLSVAGRLDFTLLEPAGILQLAVSSLAGLAVAILLLRALESGAVPKVLLRVGERLLLGAPLALLGAVVMAVGEFSPMIIGVAVTGIAALFVALPPARSGWIVSAVWGLSIAAGLIVFSTRTPFAGAPAESAGASGRSIRKVLLLTVDTLRADALSCYSENGVSTPNLDHLATDSVLFRAAYSASSWTLPSLSSLLTGLPPRVHQVYLMESRIAPEFPTIPAALSEAGYATAAVVVNPLITRAAGFSRGFDEYAFHQDEWPQNEPVGRKILRKALPGRFQTSTEMLTQTAIKWLEENHERDFFLWLHYFDPHDPFAPPEEFWPEQRPPDLRWWADSGDPSGHTTRGGLLETVRGGWQLSQRERSWIRLLYGSEVRYVDHSIGRIITKLKELGLYDELLLIFTSDHGEEFWDHGSMGHGHAMYEEVLRIPLMVKLPNSSQAGELATRVTNLAVPKTILDLCGVAYQSDCYAPPSLVSYLNAGGTSPGGSASTVLSSGTCYYEPQDAYIANDEKLIFKNESGSEKVFNLAEDPGETRSLSWTEPELSGKLRRALEQQNARLDEVRKCFAPSASANDSIDQRRLERLKALGYLQ